MNRTCRTHCCLFDCLLNFESDGIRAAFGDGLSAASQQGPCALVRVWSDVFSETVALTAARYAARVSLILTATALASAFTIGSAQAQPQSSRASDSGGSLIQLPNGHHMFLECSGDQDAVPTVILANGRGFGTADSWTLVQQKVPASIRVCSYDAIGAGHSDKIQESHSIDQVASEMDALFKAARLQKPYVLVGASAGGVLIRRYQQQHTNEVAGLVFVDSSHEEMQWRDAAIAPQMDPDWNNPAALRDNGFLPDHQKFTWRADIPLVVLERSEKVPQSAFPNLTPQQIDGINAAWHDFQVDLASRSKYGELRIVPNSGHRMHQERPDAIADAIQDVVHQIRAKAH